MLTYILPFARGTTWKDGNTASTAGSVASQPGTIVVCDQKSAPEAMRHSVNFDQQQLIILRNRTSAAIKRGASGREDSRLWKLRASSAYGFGNVTTVAAFGDMGYPIDDAMVTSKGIAVGDDGYFTVKGFARLTLITAVSACVPGETRLIARTGGYVGPQTAAGTIKHTIGVAMETVTAATAGKRTILVLMGADFNNLDNS